MNIYSLTKNTIFAFSLIICSQLTQADELINEPPQEMFDACKDKQTGEKCSYYDAAKGNLKGICTKDSRVILCYPDEPKPKKE